MSPNLAIWLICAAATAAVILRPFKVPEAVWAVAGALLLVLTGLLPLPDALAAVGKGLDVYLFLTGMMLLSELARQEGLFDYVAAQAVRHAGGSASRLFMLIYGAGVLVTVFMSNDATAVVLTPAVYAAARKADVEPLPYLFACALVANAASFVLPISNPANLVVFGGQMPALGAWVLQFALPSLAAIAVTFGVLRLHFRKSLGGRVATAQAWAGAGESAAGPQLGRNGQFAAAAVGAVAVVLLVASLMGWDLGAPAFGATALAAALALARRRQSPLPLLRQISWGVLPLVAGLFVMVEALARTGVLASAAAWLHSLAGASPRQALWSAGLAAGFGSNLVNNLPAGLIAGNVAVAAQATHAIRSAIAIGIDLGPNLSVTGSLATLLWLTAIRREGEDVSAWQFLKVGAVAMPLALVAALMALG